MWWRVAFLLLLATWPAGAQDALLRWEQLCDGTTCGTTPVARRGHGAVAHVAGNQAAMVIHGGFNEAVHGEVLDDVWALRCSHLQRSLHRNRGELHTQEGCRWEQLCDSETCGALNGIPPPRVSHSLVMNGETSILLFGGHNPATGQFFSDVWQLVLGQRGHIGWQQLCTPGSVCARTGPQARAGHAATAFSPTSILVYGGTASDGSLLSDLWLFTRNMTHPDEGSWVVVTQGDEGDGPAALTGHSLVAMGDHTAVLFGGRTANGGSTAGVWLLSLVTSSTFVEGEWRLLCSDNGACNPGPSPRYNHTAVALGDDMYVFGGVGAVEGGDSPDSDLWRFTASPRDKPKWTALCQEVVGTPNVCGEAPYPRSMHSMVAFPAGELLVFGGAAMGNRLEEFRDVWQLGTAPPLFSPLPTPAKRNAHQVVVWIPLLLGLLVVMSLVVGIAYNVAIVKKSGLAAVPHYQWASSVARRVSSRLAWLLGGQAQAVVDTNPLLAGEVDPDNVDWTDFDVDDEANYL